MLRCLGERMSSAAVVFGSEEDFGDAQIMAQLLVNGDVGAEVHFAPDYDEGKIGRPDFVIVLWSAEQSGWPRLTEIAEEALRSSRLVQV